MRAGPSPIAGRFGDQVVAVTGSGSGIGMATAWRFAAEGARVVAIDIDEEAAESTSEDIRAAGLLCESVRLDQSAEAEVNRVFEQLVDRGGIDVACINAGLARPQRAVADTDVRDWDAIHDVNLRGAFLVARAAIPAIRRRQGGSIVFTSSISGVRAHPGASAYAASKAGLLGFARSLALEVAGEGIRVNTVCPGGVTTPMLRKVYGDDASQVIDQARLASPVGNIAEPEDIAAAIAFLASGDARHIIGTELVVDGGRSIGQ